MSNITWTLSNGYWYTILLYHQIILFSTLLKLLLQKPCIKQNLIIPVSSVEATCWYLLWYYYALPIEVDTHHTHQTSWFSWARWEKQKNNSPTFFPCSHINVVCLFYLFQFLETVYPVCADMSSRFDIHGTFYIYSSNSLCF